MTPLRILPSDGEVAAPVRRSQAPTSDAPSEELQPLDHQRAVDACTGMDPVGGRGDTVHWTFLSFTQEPWDTPLHQGHLNSRWETMGSQKSQTVEF